MNKKSKEQIIKTEETTVFGEKIKKNGRRHNGDPVLGIMLIMGGLILMANQSGLISPYIWEVIGRFWPVLLILWGVQIIIGEGLVSTLIMGILAILLLGSVVVIGIRETEPALIFQLGLNKLPWYNYLNLINLK